MSTAGASKMLKEFVASSMTRIEIVDRRTFRPDKEMAAALTALIEKGGREYQSITVMKVGTRYYLRKLW